MRGLFRNVRTILNNEGQITYFIALRGLFSVYSLATLIVLFLSCNKSESTTLKSEKKYKVQQKLCINEMLVLSNKTIGVTFVDLTRIEKNKVDYRWRHWASNSSAEKAGTGSSTLIPLKMGKDETHYFGSGSFLKVGDARLVWNNGEADYIFVMYTQGDTAVWVSPDNNFDLEKR